MKRLILAFVAMVIGTVAYSQDFNFGMKASANFSQIDGDAYTGYNKVAFNFGILTEYPLSERLRAHLEIGYSGKGARDNGDNTTIVSLGYVEIPLLLHFEISEKFDVGVGLVPSVLVTHKTTENGSDNTSLINNTNGYNRFELPYAVDARFWFNPHFGINARFTYSLLNIREEKISGSRKGLLSTGQFNNVLSAGLIWRM